VLQSIRRHWLIGSIVALLVIGGLLTVTLMRRSAETGHEEADLPEKPEAPPDLQKLREAYANGVAALGRGDGPDAVKHLSSFDFGNRAVEEYRLYHLARGHELAKDSAATRATLARLWRRKPKMVHATEATLSLAKLYNESGAFAQSAAVASSVNAHWAAATAALHAGDLPAALHSARRVVIDTPAAAEARDANALIRALGGLPETAAIPLTQQERLDRASKLMYAQKPQDALEELTALDAVAAPSLKTQIQLQRGIALHLLRRYEDSNKVLEPLTSGPFKYAIPALRHTAKNYAIVSAAINPEVFKTVKERKKVGTIKQRVGKGKKRRTVTKPRYQTVSRQVKLIDLAKKNKKDEYSRLASERLKDLLSLPIDDDVRFETLNTLITRAAAKNQDAYVRELVPQVIKLDPLADPALQHFWDKGWAAYSRGDLNTAKMLFRFVADTYTHPNVRRQSEYWFARCVERQGQKEEARAIYQKLASAPYEDLYAQHAVARGAKKASVTGNPLKDKRPDWQDIAEKEMPAELRMAYELTALSAMKDAFAEARKNLHRTNSRFAHAIYADVYHATGQTIPMYQAIRKAWPQLATVEQDTVPAYFFRMYYPVKYGDAIEEHAKKQSLDPNLVRGLILQESYYNPKAKSRVGATGLMQLMPPTAQEHARRMGIPFAISRLENPEVNIRLGTYHLRMLVNMFRGSVPLAVASYNAGQGNVLKWRRAAPGKPLDEFLESIPFPETRNYVKRVTLLRSTYARLTS
jgi:soluble lytic murein transglycosylase-like protein